MRVAGSERQVRCVREITEHYTSWLDITQGIVYG